MGEREDRARKHGGEDRALPGRLADCLCSPYFLAIRRRQPFSDDLLRPCMLIIDNPNNPTGRTLLDRWGVEVILEHGNALLVIDEAYYEFSGITFADMVADHAQLTIIRTMDKAFSLAGARVGYGVAGEAFLDALSSFYAFLPQPSLCAAMEALKQPNYMRENVRRVVEERERLWQMLDELGVHVHPSSTNFLLVRAEVPELVTRLRDAGVLVSDVSNQLPAGFFRVSIGTPEENDAFVGALAQRIRKYSPASDSNARQSRRVSW